MAFAVRVLPLIALLMAGCSHGGPATGSGEIVDAETRVVEPYRLDAADKLRITTFGEPSLTGEFQVSDAGTVSFPLIGPVRATGLTINEFQKSVAAKLRDGYLRDPKVSVELLGYRPYYILGEVNKPGEYPYMPGLTVMKAVATANGFTYRANTKRVYIKRPRDQAEVRYPLTATIRVAPGDIIRIEERFF